MKLFVLIENEEDLYIEECDNFVNAEKLAKRNIERLAERYGQLAFDFFIQDDFSMPVIYKFNVKL
jgi:hypothetical protein